MSVPVVERSTTIVNPDYSNEVDLSAFEEQFEAEETSDPKARAHIVSPDGNTHIWRNGMTTQELVDIARNTQQELVALCGYRWVPKFKPDNLEVCEKCLKIAQRWIREDGK